MLNALNDTTNDYKGETENSDIQEQDNLSMIDKKLANQVSYKIF